MTNDLQGEVDIDKRGTKKLPPLAPRTEEFSPRTDVITSVEPETVNELQSEAAETSERERKHAIFYSTSANKHHRLPRSNASKRNQVELLLCAPEWQIRSDRAIAEHCDVSAPFVGKIRSELAQKGTVNLSSERVDRKGRRIETANIGTKPHLELAKSAPTSQEQELEPLAVTGSQSLEQSPTTTALIKETMPERETELLKRSSPEGLLALLSELPLEPLLAIQKQLPTIIEQKRELSRYPLDAGQNWTTVEDSGQVASLSS